MASTSTGQYTSPPTQQLAQALSDENTLGNYTINTFFADSKDGLSTCGAVSVVTPEPATTGLLGLEFVALLFVGRRRWHRVSK